VKSKLVLIALILLVLLPTASAQEYTPIGLEFTVYGDGTVKIDYRIETDPTELRVEIPVFGTHYEGVSIRNLDNLPLASTPTEAGFLVETLGSLWLNMTYYTSSLTTKVSLVWSINVTTPIEAWITLPDQAIIFDISDIPLDIVTVDGGKSILLAAGDLSVSYIVGISTIRDRAEEAMEDAESFILTYVGEGLVLTEAEALLEKAQQNYAVGDYSEAKLLAEQSLEATLNIVDDANSAFETLDEAYQTVSEARSEGRTSGIEAVEERLQQAYDAYEAGDYGVAESLASEVELEAVSLRKSSSFNLMMGGLLFIIVVTVAFYFMRTRGPLASVSIGVSRDERAQEEGVTIDVKAIFEEHPDLRMGDREVVRFLAEFGGEAFAYEIRERFDLPRSSAWRLIRRLTGLEIVEEVKMGNQSFIKILERYREG
jgi:uncharacterized membrane protein